eukprot:TRINITY_DN9265_c3_g1_i1.p2 TRINITY_DN9265_c3_g1~~TRINITY_DN9265_c3_g1_i1.p2  ORF type:complete len:482 (+),score=95.03 TRINITY_DN9265_c3_g1_i1:89-1447(+)
MRTGGGTRGSRGAAAPEGGKGVGLSSAKGKGQGNMPAAAAAGGEQCFGAGAVLALSWVADPDQWTDAVRLTVRRAPEFSLAGGLLDAGGVGNYTAAVTAKGAVLCFDSARGSLGTVTLPWPAAAVSCGGDHRAAAVRRGGGAVCEWDMKDADFSEGGAALGVPADKVLAVAGLPPGDAVAAAEVGEYGAVARTANGAMYGWDPGFVENGLAATSTTAIQIAPRRVRSIAVACVGVLAETEDWTLTFFPNYNRYSPDSDPRLCYHQRFDPVVALPLRHMAASHHLFILADAHGAVCTTTRGSPVGGRLLEPVRVHLPEGRRAVRVAGAIAGGILAVVALTECGELRDCTGRWYGRGVRARSISAARGLSLGLQPCGGSRADRILLLPDTCCGKSRLRLVARIAVRLGLPCDPLREALTPYAVARCYIGGPAHDPFGWPDPEAGGAAAAAAAAR